MEYLKWDLIDDVGSEYYLDRLIDAVDDLTIYIRGKMSDRVLKINFSVPLSYKNTCSGDLLKSSGIEGFRGDFVKSENSEYLSWFLEESMDNWKDQDITHYSIRTINHVIDVISPRSPVVEWQH